MTQPHSHICHIVVAGGSGSRFGAELPKQLCPLMGRPVLMHTIDSFRAATPGAQIIVAMHPAYMDVWRDMCAESSYASPLVVAGGSTRWESVRNALAAVDSQADVITVHDAARPLVDPSLIRRVVSAVESGATGAIPVIAVTDSLRRVNGESGASQAADRSQFRAVQTPQGFPARLLRKAYSLPFSPGFTDDASVMEAAGFGPLTLVEGSPYNIKITHPADIEIAALLASHL